MTEITMASKKPYTFAVKHDQEVPAIKRTGNRLPFPFDGMKLNSMFNVPKEFWKDHGGLTKEQYEDKQRNKEAIRRSFYGWRDGDAKRKDLAVAMSDQFDKDNEYTGVNVYLVKSSGPIAQPKGNKKKAA